MEDLRSEEYYLSDPGPYLARIVSHTDAKYMGTLQVELLNDVGRDQNATGSVIQVRYLSPFAGQTSVAYIQENNDYNGTQKSYGMWMVPPDVGTTVMVIFVNGDISKGFWIGCVPDEYMNFMVPGLAATETTTENGADRKVVAEFNKKKNDLSRTDQTLVPKPVHPFQKVLEAQGLDKDDVRGITTSSARRETPSTVFGISTPGPVDRTPGAPTGRKGKRESRVEDAFISRLGGATFVMDDGDDNFLRKTKASEGPPEYASIENRENGGQPDIPHNELVRIRTRTGHQILLHNSEDLIYIGNAAGTTWIELTSKGKIDIYAADSVNIRTKTDLNFYADGNINMEAGGNIGIKAGGNIQAEAGNDYGLIVGGDGKVRVANSYNLTAGTGAKIRVTGDMEILTAGNNRFTASVDTDILSGGDNHFTAMDTDILSAGQVTVTGVKINLNSGAAAPALAATPAETPTALPTTEGSIVPRRPDVEPWAGHENLHGSELKYSTTTDTFKKISK